MKQNSAALGEIPGVSYDITGWSINRLRQWLQQNIGEILPSLISTHAVQADNVTVNSKVTLSSAALADLKKQLGL